MELTTPYLRTQTELLADIENLIRDTSNARWTEAEIYRCINQALLTWHDKVLLPYIYTISGGWVAGTYSYALPSYLRPPLYPQLSRSVPYSEFGYDSTSSTWQDVPGWSLEPTSTGGITLRLNAPPRTVDGRVIWFGPNSRVPLPTLPTTNAQIVAADTSVTMGSAVDVDDTGYIKINAEYMSYAGVTRTASTTTLTNLVRALNGSTAATHSSSSTVTWCVAVDDMRLYSHLYNQVRMFLNALPLTDGGVHERTMYEKMMGYYQGLVDTFWPTYHPARPAHKLTLSRKSFNLR